MYRPTNELPATVVDAIAQVTAVELPRLTQVIPAAPAAELGRLSLAPDALGAKPGRLGLASPASALTRAIPATPGAGSGRRGLAPAAIAGRHTSGVRAGLAGLPPLVAERLLGALELTVAALDLPVPLLVAALPEASGEARAVSIAHASHDSEMSVELSKLDAFVPRAADMVAGVAAELAGHPSIAPLLVGDGTDEAAIAASHGAKYLALAVVTAAIVLRPLWPNVTVPALVGTALGAAAPLLRAAPMPADYADAVLAERRASYLMPRHSSGRAVVTDHVFTLAEGPLESTVDFTENGLVAAIPGGIAIRAGRQSDSVSFALHMVETPPEPDLSLWDEIVEVSWHAPNGAAVVSGSPGGSNTTPPWPGDYRALVSARGRDEDHEYQEYHDVVVWRSPAADPVVHKRSDRLGHMLRGEPEPPEVVVPDAVYHWVERISLSDAATVTFVRDKSSPEVLRAFGADPSAPASLREFSERDYQNIDPWVCVLDVPGGVIAIEFNGWQGSDGPVLRALSSPHTRAASMFWNVNALRRFSLARNGEVLASFELGLDSTTSPEALELLSDVDLDGHHRTAIGLLAASRFTGLSLSAEDLARVEAAAVGYPILPLLPELHVEQRLPDGSRCWAGHGPLDADTDDLAALSDSRLRDLAWWAASFAVARSEMSEHPEVTASLAARALTPEAELLGRHSQLYGQGQHHWLWMSLHRATNPDPLAAAIGALDAARYAVAGSAAELLKQARARMT